MRICFAFLFVFPLAFAMPQRRVLLDTFLDTGLLKDFTANLTAALGSDTSEQACESTCHTLIQQDHLLQFSCPLVCHSLQSLIHHFGLHGKRMLLDTLFNTTQMTSFLTSLSCTLGTDTSEQACETECHTLIQADHLLQFSCPLICKSFQSLVHRFGIHANPCPSPVSAKRLLLDTIFDHGQIKVFLTDLSCKLGTDESEQGCEAQCHTLIQADHLLQFSCPLVCKSFQTLIIRFGVQQLQSCTNVAPTVQGSVSS